MVKFTTHAQRRMVERDINYDMVVEKPLCVVKALNAIDHAKHARIIVKEVKGVWRATQETIAD